MQARQLAICTCLRQFKNKTDWKSNICIIKTSFCRNTAVSQFLLVAFRVHGSFWCLKPPAFSYDALPRSRWLGRGSVMVKMLACHHCSEVQISTRDTHCMFAGRACIVPNGSWSLGHGVLALSCSYYNDFRLKGWERSISTTPPTFFKKKKKQQHNPLTDDP